jgi:hypothetical protein
MWHVGFYVSKTQKLFLHLNVQLFFIEVVTLVGMCVHIDYTLPLLVDSYAWNEIYKSFGNVKSNMSHLQQYTKIIKMPTLHNLIIKDKVVLLVVIFKKWSVSVRHKWFPLPDHQNPVDMHTSIMSINILQNIKAVAPKL